MQKEQCFSLGKITKLHGYKGAVVLHIDSSTPQYFKELESVLLEIDQELVPFFVASRGKLNGKKLVVSFEDVDPNQAKILV
ncbi:MAG: 16S rRNA processing protein RimM, partial [Schleiferiaceae bacterium]|nr:16S rRNA processing protein RimM [Schleiferiaceae bacterium]